MSDRSLWSLFLDACLINNFVLAYFLGICPFLGVSNARGTALRNGGQGLLLHEHTRGLFVGAQNIISDLFASLSIVLDRPFVLGDFLVIDDYYGNVEKVGLKTTRVRSLSGEQLVFANNDLLNSRIRNYGQMVERRIVFSVGVTYQTSPETLERIPAMIEEIIVAQESARFDRSHFKQYGAFSLDFETVYYVESSDYRLYMDIQQAVNLELFRRFNAAGIEFAYPTPTLFVNQAGA